MGSSTETPATMNALLQYGKEGAHNFRVAQAPTPKAHAQQVLIRVHAASLNPIDIKRGVLCNDTYPITVGYDVAGVVVALGDGVSELSLGDRVFGDIMRHSAGHKLCGTVAEYCVCAADLLARIPQHVSFEHAAALPVAALTSIEAFERMGARSGHNVFVSGGAGGVGVHAMQVARNVFGAAQVATTASAPKFEFVKQYGADVVVDYRNELVGEKLGAWADIALDCVGDVEGTEKVLKRDGKMVTIVNAGAHFMMLTPTNALINTLAQILEQRKLTVVLDSVYSLSKAPEALARLSSGRAKGKIVVKIVE